MAAIDGEYDDEVLKPFFRRAAEAEERLAKLEAALAESQDKSGTSNQDFSLIENEFKSKLQIGQNQLKSDHEKASKEIKRLEVENAKLHYRILHLVRALRDMDSSSSSNHGA